MLQEMFINYWIEWLFGLIALGISVFAKHYISLEKKSLADRQTALRTQIKDEISQQLDDEVTVLKEEDIKIHEELGIVRTSIDALSQGVLSVQGRDFKDECRKLLASDHEITLDEWEQIDEDHIIYNELGGNHRGDTLYKAVADKWQSQLKK